MDAPDAPDAPDAGAAVALLGEHRYADARAAYEALLADGEDAGLLVGLGAACRAVDDIPSAITALERAFVLQVEAGDPGGAAETACTLADVELSHLGASAVASGWLGRARQLLDGLPDHPAHLLLEGQSAYLQLAYEKDPVAAREHAARAVEHATRRGDAAAAVVGRAYLGLVEVSMGRLGDGMQLLDEATAAASAGELEPLEALDVYCLLLTSCARVRDFERVGQWSRHVLSLASDAGSDGFATFARTQYATMLLWQGRWVQAEVELDRVLRDAAERPLTAAMGMVLRGGLRRRQGRLDEADAELLVAEREPYRRGVRHMVLAARAQLTFAQGDAQGAADLVQRYLRSVAESDRIERLDALETLVRARLALGQLPAAAEAVKELEETAAMLGTDGVRGAALAARGRVTAAGGDPDGGVEQLLDAVERFDAAAMPYELCESRVALAGALLAAGRVDAAGREAEQAVAAAEALGAELVARDARRVLAGLRGEVADASGLTRRELDVLQRMGAGGSNADIAEELVLSVRTVERHVSNIYLKLGVTGAAARTAAVAHARREGLL